MWRPTGRAAPHDLGPAASAPPVAASALARLFPRRLVRCLGHLRAPCRGGRMGGERGGNVRAPPRRRDAGDPGARGGEEQQEVAGCNISMKWYNADMTKEQIKVMLDRILT